MSVPIISSVAVVLFFVVGFYLENKSKKRAEAALLAKSEAWLKEQKALPRWRVKVSTNYGTTYFSKHFEPTSEISYWYRGYVESHSSLGRAESYIEDVITAGRYKDDAFHKFIPLCEIISITAEEQE